MSAEVKSKWISIKITQVELITKYRKVYSEFIESIDFDLLQQSDKYDKQTNKRTQFMKKDKK